jgi:hypothetical protein
MRLFTYLIILLLPAFCCAQQNKNATTDQGNQAAKASNPTPPINNYFHVIVSLSALNTDATVNSIKSLINAGNSGLSYEGYCKNQKCLILRASTSKYASPNEVIAYLQAQEGNAVMCFKDYTVGEFYRVCTFPTEDEYQYFKTTYR